MKKPIKLYHCPYCLYEAGREIAVAKHIKNAHDEEFLIANPTNEREDM